MEKAVKTTCRETLQTFPGQQSGSDETVDDDDFICKPWGSLPYYALVHVASYLQDVDRRHVALVCQSWYLATRDASLWRDKQFFLLSSHQIPRNIKWLHSHSNHLRHAAVMCFGSFDAPRATFFDQLKRTRLWSLELNGTAYWWSSAKKDVHVVDVDILSKLIDLIRSQKRLVFFQMRQALLSFNTGINLLNKLAHTSGSTITRLGLEDFFGEEESKPCADPALTHIALFSQCMARFSYLSEITVNYQYVSEPLLQWFTQNRKRQSVTLNVISWQNSFPTREGISAETWRCFATVCAPARVCFTLQNIKNIKRLINSVLLKTIPLYRLNLLGLTATNEGDSAQLIRLLKHVEKSYNKSIVGFKLWGNNKLCDEVEEALIGLLTGCHALVDLDLHMDLQPGLMGRVCRLQHLDKIGLQSFRMARSLSHTAEFDEFRRCIQYWYPLYKNLKMDFQIRAESSPIHIAHRTYSFLVADNRSIIDHVDDRNHTNDLHSRHNVNNSNNSKEDCLWSLTMGDTDIFAMSDSLRMCHLDIHSVISGKKSRLIG